jgi:TRAP-type C4-dicarboxylate transport system substrate-binding protein
MNTISLTDEQKKIIKDAIQESIDAHIRIAAEKDHLKAIADSIKEKLDIKPAMFNQMVGEAYEKKVTTQIEKLQDVSDMVSVVFGRTE